MKNCKIEESFEGDFLERSLACRNNRKSYFTHSIYYLDKNLPFSTMHPSILPCNFIFPMLKNLERSFSPDNDTPTGHFRPSVHSA